MSAVTTRMPMPAGLAFGLGLLAGLVLALLLALAVAVGIAFALERRARSRRIGSLAALAADRRPARIVVLGCPPTTRRGRPSRYLIGRVEAAAAAWHGLPGDAQSVTVLCSGRDDEIEALAALLEAARVPRSVLRFDPTAQRTIDTIEHLVAHYADARILLVTQSFHLPRTLYLARARSLDAWGLAAPGPRPGWRGKLREALGQLRAVWDVARLRPGR